MIFIHILKTLIEQPVSLRNRAFFNSAVGFNVLRCMSCVVKHKIMTSAVQWRYVVTVLAFLGFISMYSLRVNLSIAIVVMTEDTISNSVLNSTGVTTTCRFRNRSISTFRNVSNKGSKGLSFKWDQRLQGLILSSFFYGYISTQFLGGLLAHKFGAKWVFGLGNLLTALLTLLSPTLAYCSPYAFIALQVLQVGCS